MPDGFRLETPASVMRLAARPVGAQSDKLTPLAARMRKIGRLANPSRAGLAARACVAASPQRDPGKSTAPILRTATAYARAQSRARCGGGTVQAQSRAAGWAIRRSVYGLNPLDRNADSTRSPLLEQMPGFV
jgi:hypothetical protein